MFGVLIEGCIGHLNCLCVCSSIRMIPSAYESGKYTSAHSNICKHIQKLMENFKVHILKKDI